MKSIDGKMPEALITISSFLPEQDLAEGGTEEHINNPSHPNIDYHPIGTLSISLESKEIKDEYKDCL